jgi:hypothetical protein
MINQTTQTQYELKGTMMKEVIRSTMAVLLGVLIATPFASAQEKSNPLFRGGPMLDNRPNY